MRAIGARARIGAADDMPSDDVDVLPTSSARASRDDEYATFMTGAQATLLRTPWLLVGDARRAEELARESLARTYAAWLRAWRPNPDRALTRARPTRPPGAAHPTSTGPRTSRGSGILVTSPAPTNSSPTASSSDGVNEPSELFIASMM